MPTASAAHCAPPSPLLLLLVDEPSNAPAASKNPRPLAIADWLGNNVVHAVPEEEKTGAETPGKSRALEEEETRADSGVFVGGCLSSLSR